MFETEAAIWQHRLACTDIRSTDSHFHSPFFQSVLHIYSLTVVIKSSVNKTLSGDLGEEHCGDIYLMKEIPHLLLEKCFFLNNKKFQFNCNRQKFLYCVCSWFKSFLHILIVLIFTSLSLEKPAVVTGFVHSCPGISFVFVFLLTWSNTNWTTRSKFSLPRVDCSIQLCSSGVDGAVDSVLIRKVQHYPNLIHV